MANNQYTNKIIFGNQALMDLTSDTIEAGKLFSGYTAHDKSGAPITGTYDFATATAGTATASDIKKGKTAWVGGVYITGTAEVPLNEISWSTDSDEDIVRAINAHYQGKIDLTEQWNVGDERVIHLSAMSASYVDETHAAQDVTYTLLHKGGYTLTNSINGITECAYAVGQKISLNEGGKMYTSLPSQYRWSTCPRRSWCNEVYRYAIPSTLRPIFKQHKIKSVNYVDYPSSDVLEEVNDYFTLPSEKNLYSSREWGSSEESNNDVHLSYYEDNASRTKTNGSLYYYWTRSTIYRYNNMPTRGITGYGWKTSGYSDLTNVIGLAPQSVI